MERSMITYIRVHVFLFPANNIQQTTNSFFTTKALRPRRCTNRSGFSVFSCLRANNLPTFCHLDKASWKWRTESSQITYLRVLVFPFPANNIQQTTNSFFTTKALRSRRNIKNRYWILSVHAFTRFRVYERTANSEQPTAYREQPTANSELHKTYIEQR